MPSAKQLETHIKNAQLRPSMSFQQKVWAVCARVPKGQVTTYGQIARKLRRPGAARAVGGALHRNPYAPQVPCHRVVGADGRLTGFARGLAAKKQMLAREGITFTSGKVNLRKHFVSL